MSQYVITELNYIALFCLCQLRPSAVLQQHICGQTRCLPILYVHHICRLVRCVYGLSDKPILTNTWNHVATLFAHMTSMVCFAMVRTKELPPPHQNYVRRGKNLGAQPVKTSHTAVYRKNLSCPQAQPLSPFPLCDSRRSHCTQCNPREPHAQNGGTNNDFTMDIQG